MVGPNFLLKTSRWALEKHPYNAAFETVGEFALSCLIRFSVSAFGNRFRLLANSAVGGAGVLE